MRIHRFYTTEVIGNKTEFTISSADLVNQVRRVFRLKSGDFVIVFDGSGSDYECSIVDFGKDTISLNVVSARRSHYMPTRDVYLYAAVVKKDTFEWIVEKATELGVTHIIPVMAERSEKKSLNEERLKKIAIEASEQSGRGSVPIIYPIVTLKEALCVTPSKDGVQEKEHNSESVTLDSGLRRNDDLQCVAFHTDAPAFSKSDITSDVSLGLFIGPEGGWSADEITMFHSHEIPTKSLGNQVLRAETAAVAALSVVILGN